MAQRRLAAIMFTDIVGYDSLLKEDEKKALGTLRKNQRIHRRLIKKFNGRRLKIMGSGMLVSFSSVIDAVTCALAIQKAKRAIYEGLGMDLQSSLDYLLSAVGELWKTEDHKEGARAFVEKREPVFKGR